MKVRNTAFTIASLLLITGLSVAQENPSEGMETTTSKTYQVDMGNEVVSRTVEISTKKSNSVKLDETDEGKINQDRAAKGIAMITKTVRIDNDKDDDFDEKIVFTYDSNTPEDFILISKNEELMVAIDDGENLKIVEDITLKSKNEVENNSTYIFTDGKGKEIEFLVEEHTSTKHKKSGSK